MSTLTRYRTVVHNLARIYSAGDAERTSILKTGLEEILAGIGPITPAQWELVRHDSKCLLRVWAAREKNAVADTLVEQLLDMMEELLSVTVTVDPPKGPTPPATVASVPVAETIHHVTPMLIPAVASVSPKAVVSLPPAVAAVATEEKTVTLIVEELVPEVEEEEVEETEEEVVEEEEVDETVEEEEEEVVEETEEEVVEEEEEVVEEEEEEEEVEETVEEEEEEEVLEPETEEAAEEEEAGMEVEQVFIRGRAYWLETNTQKLYAIVDEEDVGDEVGAMVNGKPQFLAAAK
jgi:hypothetical protein